MPETRDNRPVHDVISQSFHSPVDERTNTTRLPPLPVTPATHTISLLTNGGLQGTAHLELSSHSTKHGRKSPEHNEFFGRIHKPLVGEMERTRRAFH
jgi:hypothetical protein